MPAFQENIGNVCRQCNAQRLFVRTRHETNHVLHLLISALLCGLWIPVWVYLAYHENADQWRCTKCGNTL